MNLLFLDFDDIICLNKPYGGYDVVRSAYEEPADLWERLLDPACVGVLRAILDEHRPQVVITTSWLRFLDRQGMEGVLARVGLQQLRDALHPEWEAPQLRGDTRCAAIERWLAAHHRGEPLVILDDRLSGTGLVGSRLDQAGRVVLCEENVGLTEAHIERVRRAYTA